jgi:rhodanese-related sulfurtransferase
MLTLTPEVTEVDVDALERRAPDAVVLDVREPEEYAQGHVPGALSLPQADLASRLDGVPRDHLLYTICHSGRRSLNAARFLKQTGYSEVLNVRGGTEAWCMAGKPLEGAEGAMAGRRIAESEWSHAGGAPVFSWDV